MHISSPPLVVLVIFVILIAIATLVLRFFCHDAGCAQVLAFTAKDIQDYAQAWAPWSALVTIVLLIIHSFVPLPAEIIAIANGMMFGLVGGVLVTWIGALLGAVFSFAIARGLGRPALRWLLPQRQWHVFEGLTLRPVTLLTVRLIPVISFNLINYAAGVAGVGWRPFLWTTSIGILPLTIVSVAFGDALPRINLLLSGIAAVILAVIGLILWHRHSDYFASFISANRPSQSKHRSEGTGARSGKPP